MGNKVDIRYYIIMTHNCIVLYSSLLHGRIFRGGLGGFKPPQGRVNTPPENVETPQKIWKPPPEILLIFNIPNYSLDYFTTMKLF